MKKQNIHTFMHVPYEGLGCIENWIITQGHSLSYTKFYEPYILPDINAIDWLIVMGGNMSVYEEAQYPWLSEEKQFIRQMIDSNKVVIGICLGSQLIAEVLGARVFPNLKKEIGWFDIFKSKNQELHPIQNIFESEFIVFHWHGDTFDLPLNSKHLFYSKITNNQGFIYNDKVLALQFHLEVTDHTLLEMIENGKSELNMSETIQTEEQILSQRNCIDNNNHIMYKILDYLLKI